MENKEIDFSIILNARSRIPLLENFFQSVIDTTDSLDRIEVMLRIDDDDDESILFSKNCNYPFRVKWFIGPRPHSLNASLNLLAKESTGKYIQNLNNDAMFLPNLDKNGNKVGWDTTVLKEVEEYKKTHSILDGVVFLSTDCDSVDKVSGKGYSSFPIISREAFNCLSYYMREEFLSLGADAHLYRTFRAVQRVVPTSLKFSHILHSSFLQVWLPDEVNQSVRTKAISNQLNPDTFPIEEDVKKLQDYIKNYGQKN